MYNILENHIFENNTWIHIGVSYSNGCQLTFRSNVDTRFSLLLYNPRLAVTMGGSYFDDMTSVKPTNYASRKCSVDHSQFNFTQMYGEIDDLKVFARALTTSEFVALASAKERPS